MRRMLLLSAFIALGVGLALTLTLTQSNVIDQRKAHMKAMGGAASQMSRMAKGEEAFDLATVKAGLKMIANRTKESSPLFPAGSDKGDTRALPAIWEDKAKFANILVGLWATATLASTEITDEASFKAGIGNVLGNCNACHRLFRAP